MLFLFWFGKFFFIFLTVLVLIANNSSLSLFEKFESSKYFSLSNFVLTRTSDFECPRAMPFRYDKALFSTDFLTIVRNLSSDILDMSCSLWVILSSNISAWTWPYQSSFVYILFWTKLQKVLPLPLYLSTYYNLLFAPLAMIVAQPCPGHTYWWSGWSGLTNRKCTYCRFQYWPELAETLCTC